MASVTGPMLESGPPVASLPPVRQPRRGGFVVARQAAVPALEHERHRPAPDHGPPGPPAGPPAAEAPADGAHPRGPGGAGPRLHGVRDDDGGPLPPAPAPGPAGGSAGAGNPR